MLGAAAAAQRSPEHVAQQVTVWPEFAAAEPLLPPPPPLRLELMFGIDRIRRPAADRVARVEGSGGGGEEGGGVGGAGGVEEIGMGRPLAHGSVDQRWLPQMAAQR